MYHTFITMWKVTCHLS